MTEQANQPQPDARPASAIQTLSRFLLGFCTAALLTATHWPGVAIDGPIERTDLLIHAAVFAVWAGLLAAATGLRLPALLVIGVLFAAFDESTQPLFNRVFDWTDLAADAAGVTLGCLTVRALQAKFGRKTR